MLTVCLPYQPGLPLNIVDNNSGPCVEQCVGGLEGVRGGAN